jgi:alpha,alpha-trehalase
MDPGSTGRAYQLNAPAPTTPLVWLRAAAAGTDCAKPLGAYVEDLALKPREGGVKVTRLDQIPLVWEREPELRARLAGKTPAVFLDYDGTLTPIVEDYDRAFLSDAMRATIAALARCCPVAIVSGRDVAAMRRLVGLDSLYYAGSHGFEIGGPKGWHDALEKGVEALPELDRAERELSEALRDFEGHAVERQRFAIAIHYRQVATAEVGRLEQIVEAIAGRHPRLRQGRGKKVLRLQPAIDWDKGHAVLWLLARLDLERPEVLPIYLGDDVTDEDALEALRERGIGIVVRGEDDARLSAARYALADPDDVRRFLERLAALAPGPRP